MKDLILSVSGNWGHFKKPETNNNPLTHDFITKTALIGLIGAVLGKDRDVMKPLFPQLSEDLLYGVKVVNPVKKESWGFTMRKAVNLFEKAPKYMELLKNPGFEVAVCLKNDRSKKEFIEFTRFVVESRAMFTPVLGLHNCPAILSFKANGEFTDKKSGAFKTKGFVSTRHTLNLDETRTFRIGFEKIPTFQNDDFWNLPEKYVEVVYPSEHREISVTGDYYQHSDGEAWWLV
ncbi:MAG: CRISPR-associated protein Cas5 [Candidatus Wallbacteria bacterium]|nr:CRISPR-associated protein Cas5 [Candidatus Wallbacteria bacterium]